MKFFALLRKELRECLPWMILAAITLLAIGGFCLRMTHAYQSSAWSSDNFSLGLEREYGLVDRYSPLTMVAPVLLLSSVGLGLILSARQFCLPFFTRTWPFLIHRSIARSTIFWAKLTAAVTAFLISLGAVWSLLYWYSCRPGLFPMLPIPRVFVEGWIFIALGLVVYLGTALTALSTARWYTTKIFGFVFAALVIFPVTLQWQIGWALVLTIASALILLCQTINTFLKRQF